MGSTRGACRWAPFTPAATPPRTKATDAARKMHTGAWKIALLQAEQRLHMQRALPDMEAHRSRRSVPVATVTKTSSQQADANAPAEKPFIAVSHANRHTGRNTKNSAPPKKTSPDQVTQAARKLQKRAWKSLRSAQPRCCAVNSRHRHLRAAVETRTFKSLRVCSDEQKCHRICSYDYVLPLGIKLC